MLLRRHAVSPLANCCFTMRRKVGVSVVKRKQYENAQFSKVGKSLEDNKISAVKEVLASFKTALSEFASKHKGRINSDPEFRQQFHKMCVSAGVDPLASSKGLWADILGVGDFYFELGVKIVQTTVQTRAANGGLMPLNEVYQIITENDKAKNKSHHLSIDDIVKAVEKLSVLGGGFKLINTKTNKMIMSVPLEISTDHEYLLSTASDEGGYLTASLVKGMYGWTDERFKMIMNPLLLEGMVWVDDGSFDERRYYFPSLWTTPTDDVQQTLVTSKS